MRSSLIIAVSALGLLAGPALAQTSSPSTSPSTLPGAAPAPRPAPDPLAQEDTSQIKGSTVYGSDDKKIGSVSAVLMTPENKTIDRLVVSEGGLLGVGSHRVALPVGEFKWNSEKDAFTIGETADQLKSMPAWSAASADAAMPSEGSSTPRPPLSTAPAGSLPAPSNAGTSGSSTSE
jgi:hypothetical protein